MNRFKTLVLTALVPATLFGAGSVTLGNGEASVTWRKTKAGWGVASVAAGQRNLGAPAGADMVLFSAEAPSDEPLSVAAFGGDADIPEAQYRYMIPSWKKATGPVALGKGAEPISYRPQKMSCRGDSVVEFLYKGKDFSVRQRWSRAGGDDLRLTLTLTAHRPGWYSIPTPTLAGIEPADIDYALIPGAMRGRGISADFTHAYLYQWGVPVVPVVYRDRCATTLTSVLTTEEGVTLAVTPVPGTASDPRAKGTKLSDSWKLGLSAMNPRGEVFPTLCHPVIGEEGSFLNEGESVDYTVVYTIGTKGWWNVYNHVVNDIYSFPDELERRSNGRSLTSRLHGIRRYVVGDSTSRWRTLLFEGDTIGAQDYLGGVYRARKDAMKNADYGAMWMMGKMTGDPLITERRLPYALNFKLKQQNMKEGEMHGASRGQYYLRDSRDFVEEWGPYTEPVATTYYILCDLGNICLFEPDNRAAKEHLRAGADYLSRCQRPDGSWPVAVDSVAGKECFTDLADYRPTFYGQLVAYRILGDRRYLESARRGADWLMANAVEPARWLGVCGDTRFVPDFATAQAMEAFMELYEATGEIRYRDAAIETARQYAANIYTHCGDPDRWEDAWTGLCFEHGGVAGSANLHGPILLPSHAGTFLRIGEMTGERIFTDMARAAAVGRDAHVDPETLVASYYWNAGNKGAGPYPHHAWWQAGWIADFLVAELETRSHGEISFPKGFMAPKVGPHRSVGFAPGSVNGKPAALVLTDGAVPDNPNVEALTAAGTDGTIYALLLNNINMPQTGSITVGGVAHEFSLDPYGYGVIEFADKAKR